MWQQRNIDGTGEGAEGVLMKASTYQPSENDSEFGDKHAAMARKEAMQVLALLLGD